MRNEQFVHIIYRKGKNVNILQYNILDGCREKEKYDKLSSWIKEKNLDIITFNELNGWSKSEFQNEMLKIGFQYTHLFEMESSPYYVGVASKSPIKLIKELEEKPFYHGFLHVKINNINFFVVHLTPFESKNRELETKEIINLSKEIEEAIIIIGDLNTLSPLDKKQYEKMNTFNELRKDEVLARQHTLDHGINYKPMKMLLESGFHDFCYSKDFLHSMPSKIGQHADKNVYLRIDYILGNDQALEYLIEGRVVQELALDKLSDHYPVMCKLEDF